VKKNTLVLIYNSFGDPLFQNLILSYLKTLSEKTDVDFHLVTFEQPQYHLDEEQRSKWNSELMKNRIYWHPLTFHTGRFLLLKKLWDFISAFFLIIYLRIHFKLNYIFCFANVSASIGIIIAKILRMKTIIYSYEPHSEFQVELGLWTKSSLKFKLLNKLENYAGIHSDFILTGTKYMVERLISNGSRAKLFRAPTAVDSTKYYFDQVERNQVRKELDLDGKTVFIYLGKFGGLYYSVEIPKFLSNLEKLIPSCFFLILTPQDKELINEMFLKYVNKNQFMVSHALDHIQVRSYLAAADFALSAIPPSPAQKYRSPTKVAEYLLCGLPFITTAGVSEDDIYAEEYNVGVVVQDFETLSASSLNNLQDLLLEPKEILRKRCRQVGSKYRSKQRIDDILLQIYS
jgi:hypothetical protein